MAAGDAPSVSPDPKGSAASSADARDALPSGSRLTDHRRGGRPAVFLDRDGVLIESLILADKPYPPPNVESMRLERGVFESLARLHAAGYVLLVVTNQPDVARGIQTRQAVEAMHDRLRLLLPISGIYVCYHDTPDNCACRKPQPGMLLAGAAEHGVDLARSWMIGDRWVDIAAGQAAGCRTLLLDRPYSGRERCSPTHTVADLIEAAAMIVPDSCCRGR